MDEIDILTQRSAYLLAALQLCGRSLSAESVRETTDELASIETALQKYGGAMDDIADSRIEAKHGVGL